MRKGQSSSSAAAFIAILTVLIILYILFLPPDIREELLNERSPGSDYYDNTPQTKTTTLLRETIGRITYYKDTEKYYDIPTVRISTPVSGQLLKTVPSFFIKNSLFDKEQAKYTTTFITDTTATENVVLSFNVKEHTGPLKITLNGREIFNGEVNNNKIITIQKSDLNNNNELIFSVPNPGVAFWVANKYLIENLQITGDVTDFSNSYAIQKFVLTKTEKDSLKEVFFYFRPVCSISEVGNLQISINGETIYNSVADCGTRSFVVLDKNNIYSGANELRFSTKKGSYLLDNLKVKISLEKPAYKTYYFDINKEYFYSNPEKAKCGEYDSVCPSGCADITDPDCCFKRNGNWCALPTRNPNDRCVYYVDPSDCELCPTGYYNKNRDVPENCEGKCGDNNDGICPSDCPSNAKYYDADCCWDENPDYYFCQEVPITGIMDRCRASITYSQCELCPSDYKNEDGSKPGSCYEPSQTYTDEEEILDDKYDVVLKINFVNNDLRKRLELNINGHKISIDTTNIEFKRNIDEYVRSGSNSIEIIPKEDVDIAELTVELIKVR